MHYEFYSTSNKISANCFWRVYHLLSSALPQNEMRTRSEQEKLLDDNRYVLLCAIEEDTIIGFIALWQFAEFIFIEHFAIDEFMRGKGIGGEMLDYLKGEFNLPIVLEVELPGSTAEASRRIEFYKRHGFHLNEYEYFQPPMQEGFELLPLKIMSSPLPLSEDEFKSVKRNLYKDVYRFFEKRLD